MDEGTERDAGRVDAGRAQRPPLVDALEAPQAPAGGEALSVRALIALSEAVDHRVGWSRLRPALGIPVLIGLRERMRRRNLFDTGVPLVRAATLLGRSTAVRSLDGVDDQLDRPGTGMAGARFGRNVAWEQTRRDRSPVEMGPNPRTISTQLLARDTMIPAPKANLLLAAWLQFEVHDWFSHRPGLATQPWEVPIPPGDPWPQKVMRIRRTPVDDNPSREDPAPAYANEDTHWWDGSQIYGVGADQVRSRRGDGGTLRVDPEGLVPAYLDRDADLARVAGNSWVGLAALHTLFAREHNAIVAMLAEAHPDFDDDRLFSTARLVNAALMAKIHTVEWTPAVLGHPSTKKAMDISWWGLVGKNAGRLRRWLPKRDLITGIPGSPIDDHGVPYSLTEEFVAVYRMHPLLPDAVTFRSYTDDAEARTVPFPELGVAESRERLREFGMASTLYSLGRANPGLVCLHNFPRFLQEFEHPSGELIDLAAIDVLRNRERGVPRYNDFRRMLGMTVPASIDELTDNPTWAEQLRQVYGGDVEQVDMLVGCYAEPLPEGFAFADTAFRIFLLMASRRLKADRFFTTDYTPEYYTRKGLEWVADETMVSVLKRHHPELRPALMGVTNAFLLWGRAGGG